VIVGKVELSVVASETKCESPPLDTGMLVGVDHEFAADPERAVRVAETIEGPNPG
jgi:hypothetical protein